MKFREAFYDLTVKAVRLKNWRAPKDHIEMPVIINGARTPWCYFVDQFPREGTDGRMAILSITLLDDDCDWEVYEPEDVEAQQACASCGDLLAASSLIDSGICDFCHSRELDALHEVR